MGFMDDGDYMDDDYVFLHEHPEYDVCHLYTDETDSEEEKDPLEEDLDLYAGIDMEDFELLSDDEKLEKLKDAGLDPEDYEEHFDNFEETCENAEREELADDLDMTTEQIKILQDHDIDPEEFDRMDDDEKYETLRNEDLDPEDFEDSFDDYDDVIMNRVFEEYAEEWGISEDDVQDLYDADIDLKAFYDADDDEKLKMLLKADLDPDDYEECFDDEDFLKDLKESLGGIDPYELYDAGVDLEEFQNMEDLERIVALTKAGIDLYELDDYDDIEINGVPLSDLDDYDIDPVRFMAASPQKQLEIMLDKGMDPEDYEDFPGLKYYRSNE